jgi:hypothetical protein
VLEANRDVSARKAAEVARAQSVAREAAARAEAEAAAATRDRLQVILNDLPGGVLLMTAPDAQVEFANMAMYGRNDRADIVHRGASPDPRGRGIAADARCCCDARRHL